MRLSSLCLVANTYCVFAFPFSWLTCINGIAAIMCFANILFYKEITSAKEKNKVD